MATTTVKPGQTYSKISQQIDIPEEELRALNPGVKTLKPGQVINTRNRAYNQGFQTPTTNGFTAPTPAPFQTPTTNGFTAPPPANPFAGANVGGGVGSSTPGNRRPSRPQEPRPAAPSAAQQIIDTYANMTPANLVDAFVDPFRPPTSGGSRRPDRANPFSSANLGGGTAVANQPRSNSNKPPGLAAPAQQTNPFAGGNVGGGTGVNQPRPAAYGGSYNPTIQRPPTQPNFNQNVGVYAPTQPRPITQGFQTPTSSAPRPQPFLGSAQYLDPRYQTQGQQQAQQTVARPTAPFTGDPNDPNTALWRNYWNAAAQNPGAYSGEAAPPRVMTREEIWQMKAEQRRRGMEENTATASTGTGTQYGKAELARTITWGI